MPCTNGLNGKPCQFLGTATGTTGNAMESLNQLTEDYGRLIGELNKGLGQTKWDKLTKNLQQTMTEMTGIRDREQLGLDETFTKTDKAFQDANAALNKAIADEKSILLGHTQQRQNWISTLGKAAKFKIIDNLKQEKLEKDAARAKVEYFAQQHPHIFHKVQHRSRQRHQQWSIYLLLSCPVHPSRES